MIATLAGIVLQLASYVLAGFVTLMFLGGACRIAQVRRVTDASLLVTSLAVGPLFLAWTLEGVLLFAPSLGRIETVLAVLATLMLAGLLLGRYLWTAVRLVRSSIQLIRGVASWSRVDLVLLICCWILWASAAFLALFWPLSANDPMEYSAASRILAETHRMVDYPFLDSTVAGGYFGPWSHPPGYVLQMTWARLLALGGPIDPVLKWQAPYYAALLILLLLTLDGGRRRTARLLGCGLLMGTLGFFSHVVVGHLDALRILMFTAALLQLPDWVRGGSKRNWVGASLLMGATLYTHSIAILLFPLLSAWIVMEGLKERQSSGAVRSVIAVLGRWSLVFGLSLAPVLRQYLINVSAFGSLVADTGAVPAYSIPSLRYDEYFAITRGLWSGMSVMTRGLLAGFSRYEFFGLTYWVALVGAAFLVFRILSRRRSPSIPERRERWSLDFDLVEVRAGFFLVVFYAGVLLTVVVGDHGLIRNPRYLMTVQPMVSLVGAFGLTELLERFSKRLGNQLSLIILLVWLALGAGLTVRFIKRTVTSVGGSWALIQGGMAQVSKALSQSPVSKAVDQLRVILSESGTRVLTFRQSEVAHHISRGAYLSHLDPRVASLFSIQGGERLWKELISSGFTHIFVPGYFEPTIYATAFNELLADPARVSPVLSTSGHRIFALRGTPNEGWKSREEIRGPQQPWRVGRSRISVQATPAGVAGLFRVDCRISGDGHLRLAVRLSQDRVYSAPPRELFLWSGVLSKERTPIVAALYQAEIGENAHELVFEHSGPGEALIERIALVSLFQSVDQSMDRR